MKRISLDSLCSGALNEKINMDLAKIGHNIMDPNTDPEKARKLTITLTFKPDKSRQMIKTLVESKVSLAALEAAETVLMIGQDIHTGRVEISEYGNNHPGYHVVGDAESKQEPFDQERSDVEVIDLRKAK